MWYFSQSPYTNTKQAFTDLLIQSILGQSHTMFQFLHRYQSPRYRQCPSVTCRQSPQFRLLSQWTAKTGVDVCSVDDNDTRPRLHHRYLHTGTHNSWMLCSTCNYSQLLISTFMHCNTLSLIVDTLHRKWRQHLKYGTFDNSNTVHVNFAENLAYTGWAEPWW